MTASTNYKILQALHEDKHFRLVRAWSISLQQSVILKFCIDDPANNDNYAQLQRELDRLQQFDSSHIARALGIEQNLEHSCLVLEDVQGQRLLDFLPLAEHSCIDEGLSIAIQLFTTLEQLHHYTSCHGAIRPHTLFWDGERKHLTLIDPPLAASERHQHRYFTALLNDEIAQYFAPEQFRNMSWSTDHRADFYSAGCTLYQLFTGSTPFAGEQGRDLSYSHFARLPVDPAQRNRQLPGTLARIILRLLEKNPQNRYRNAGSVIHDLRRCRDEYRKNGRVSDFTIDTLNTPDHLHFPARLYGRETELAQLKQTMTAARYGVMPVAFVAAPAGAGKTMLIEQFLAELDDTAIRGKGKCEQLTGAAPFQGLSKALEQLLKNAQRSAEQRGEALALNDWLTKETPELGQGLVNLMPGLQNFLTRSEDDLSSPRALSQHQSLSYSLNRLLRHLVDITGQAVLFLDDLQWADNATLSLLSELIKTQPIPGLMWLFTYRNESEEFHSTLERFINEIEQHYKQTSNIELNGISELALAQMLADLLGAEWGPGSALALQCYKKCAGNPLHLTQLLCRLHENHALRPAAPNNDQNSASSWTCDVHAIDQLDVTENVVDLVLHRVKTLDSETCDVLSLAACIGHAFDSEMVAALCTIQPSQVITLLAPAVAADFIIAETDFSSAADDEANIQFYRFAHDRIQQALYRRLSSDQRARHHFDIGQQLLKHADSELNDEHLFLILEHLNKSHHLAVTPVQREQLARLNFNAATRAKTAWSYPVAKTYMDLVYQLSDVTQLRWQDISAADIHLQHAEIEYLNRNPEQAKQYIDLARSDASCSEMTRAAIYTLWLSQETLAGNYPEALRIGYELLEELDETLPQDDIRQALDQELEKLIANMHQGLIDELASAEKMSDPRKQAAMRVLQALLPSSYFTHPDLNSLIAVRMVDLSRRYGCAEETPKAYVNLGNVLALQGRHAMGYQLGDLAYQLASQAPAGPIKARTLYTFISSLNHWRRPLTTSVSLKETACDACLAVGDNEYAGYVLAFHGAINEFFASASLHDYENGLLKSGDFTARTNNTVALQVINSALLGSRRLTGRSLEPTPDWFIDNDQAFLQSCERSGKYMPCCFYFLLMALADIIEGDGASAREHIQQSEKYIEYVSSNMASAIVPFLKVLTLTYPNLLNSPLNVVTNDSLQSVEKVLQQLDSWAEQCPSNFSALSALAKAGWYACHTQSERAEEFYQQAHKLAAEYKLGWLSALAAQLAARYFKTTGSLEKSRHFQSAAFHAYHAWGAQRVVKHLADEFDRTAIDSQYFPKAEPDIESFDYQAIVEASQEIATQLVSNDLILVLVDRVIKTAHAERGLLIWIEQEAAHNSLCASGTAVSVTLVDPPRPVKGNELPLSVLHHVVNTHDVFLTGNLSQHESFGSDPYVKKERPLSVLCLPIIRTNRVLAVIYLENNLGSEMFVRQSITPLNVLAGQAAISIENVRLIESLERKVEERTEQLQQSKLEADRARQIAEAANRAKGLFLANVNHELRTPLNSIIGFSDVLSEQMFGELNDKQGEYVKDINDAGKHLLGLISDIIELARIETIDDDFVIKPEWINVRSVIDSPLRMVKERAHRRGIELTLDCPGNIGGIYADPLRIKQVVLNLLTNALKFTSQGGKVTIECSADEQAITIRVSDTGMGISAVELPHIFDRLFMGSQNKASGHEGMGLGLYLSKRLVELHQGNIQVSSVVGEGTLFTVYLPRNGGNEQ